MTEHSRPQAGGALISAVMLLLLFATLAGAMLKLNLHQQTSLAQDVQGSRALLAARAGIEWGLLRVLDPSHSTVVAPDQATWPNLPDCPVSSPLTLNDMTVTVTCTRYPSAAPGHYLEANDQRQFRIYELTATAYTGEVGSSQHVERQLRVSVTKCRDKGGNAQRGYDCL